MNALSPAIAQFRLKRASAEFQPCPVEERAHGVRTGHPHHHWRSVKKLSEAPLAADLSPLEVFQVGFHLRDFHAENCDFVDLMSGRHRNVPKK
jgi:hypothetical protein